MKSEVIELPVMATGQAVPDVYLGPSTNLWKEKVLTIRSGKKNITVAYINMDGTLNDLPSKRKIPRAFNIQEVNRFLIALMETNATEDELTRADYTMTDGRQTCIIDMDIVAQKLEDSLRQDKLSELEIDFKSQSIEPAFWYLLKYFKSLTNDSSNGDGSRHMVDSEKLLDAMNLLHEKEPDSHLSRHWMTDVKNFNTLMNVNKITIALEFQDKDPDLVDVVPVHHYVNFMDMIPLSFVKSLPRALVMDLKHLGGLERFSFGDLGIDDSDIASHSQYKIEKGHLYYHMIEAKSTGACSCGRARKYTGSCSCGRKARRSNVDIRPNFPKYTGCGCGRKLKGTGVDYYDNVTEKKRSLGIITALTLGATATWLGYQAAKMLRKKKKKSDFMKLMKGKGLTDEELDILWEEEKKKKKEKGSSVTDDDDDDGDDNDDDGRSLIFLDVPVRFTYLPEKDSGAFGALLGVGAMLVKTVVPLVAKVGPLLLKAAPIIDPVLGLVSGVVNAGAGIAGRVVTGVMGARASKKDKVATGAIKDKGIIATAPMTVTALMMLVTKSFDLAGFVFDNREFIKSAMAKIGKRLPRYLGYMLSKTNTLAKRIKLLALPAPVVEEEAIDNMIKDSTDMWKSNSLDEIKSKLIKEIRSLSTDTLIILDPNVLSFWIVMGYLTPLQVKGLIDIGELDQRFNNSNNLYGSEVVKYLRLLDAPKLLKALGGDFRSLKSIVGMCGLLDTDTLETILKSYREISREDFNDSDSLLCSGYSLSNGVIGYVPEDGDDFSIDQWLLLKAMIIVENDDYLTNGNSNQQRRYSGFMGNVDKNGSKNITPEGDETVRISAR